MTASGYEKQPDAQYYVNMIGTTDPDMVAVYRWWHEGDKDWVDIRDGTASDDTLAAQGYTAKTFQYYAYLSPAAGRVAVVRWWHPVDRDWVTMRKDEVSPTTMDSWGYTDPTSGGLGRPDQLADGTVSRSARHSPMWSLQRSRETTSSATRTR